MFSSRLAHSALNTVQCVKIDPGHAFTGMLDGPADAAVIDKIHIQVSPNCRVNYKQLPEAVLVEFLETMGAIVNVDAGIINGWATRPGLEPLFPTTDDVAQFHSFLTDRQAKLRAAYGNRVSRLGPERGGGPASAVRTTVPLLPKDMMAELRKKYGSKSVLRDPVDNREFVVGSESIRLTPLKSNSTGSGDASNLSSATLSLDPIFGATDMNLDREAGTVTVSDLFPPLPVVFQRRINIIGAAGFGKSTCCQVVSSLWASKRILSQFTLVLWVPLRRLTADRYPFRESGPITLAEVAMRECWDLPGEFTDGHRKSFEQLYSPSSTLWILDGYDEVVGVAPAHLRDTIRQLVDAPFRLLTGRPHAMGGVPCDDRYEMAGFSSGDVLAFVRAFVQSKSSASANAVTLFESLRFNRAIWALAHSPINLAFLCHVLVGDPSISGVQGVYAGVEALLLDNFTRPRFTASEAANSAARRLSSCLSGIALEATRQGLVVIPGAIVRECVAQSVSMTSDVKADGRCVGTRVEYCVLNDFLQWRS